MDYINIGFKQTGFAVSTSSISGDLTIVLFIWFNLLTQQLEFWDTNTTIITTKQTTTKQIILGLEKRNKVNWSVAHYSRSTLLKKEKRKLSKVSFFGILSTKRHLRKSHCTIYKTEPSTRIEEKSTLERTTCHRLSFRGRIRLDGREWREEDLNKMKTGAKLFYWSSWNDTSTKERTARWYSRATDSRRKRIVCAISGAELEWGGEVSASNLIIVPLCLTTSRVFRLCTENLLEKSHRQIEIRGRTSIQVPLPTTTRLSWRYIYLVTDRRFSWRRTDA